MGICSQLNGCRIGSLLRNDKVKERTQRNSCGQGHRERCRGPQADPAMLGSVRESLPGSSLYGFEELASILEAWLGGALLF